MPPDAQSDVYAALLELAAENARQLGDRELCMFPTEVGSLWAGDLLVYGRAVNGYEPRWKPGALANEADRRAIYEKTVYRNPSSGDCPLRWVMDSWGRRGKYNTKRSAFWRTVREVLTRLAPNIREESWSSYVAWGNLYRLAPGERGNPDSRLCNLQLSLCQQQLNLDLERLKPRRFLVLAGWNWASSFFRPMGFEQKREGYVEASGFHALSDGTRVAVVAAMHPQGKPQGAFVDSVMSAFSRLQAIAQ